MKYKSQEKTKTPETDKSFVVIYKQGGKFYDVYGYDAFIFNLIFDFKILEKVSKDKKTYKCGFPDNSLNKIINKLEDNKISYQIISRDKDPIVKDYKKINKYSKFKDDAIKKNNLTVRINLIIEKIKNLSSEDALAMLEKIEECLK